MSPNKKWWIANGFLISGLLGFTLACASLALEKPPALENRTLRISKEIPGFEYQYQVCAKKFLGACTKRKMKKELYDLRDEAMRMKLLNMGFVLKVREKP